MDEYAEDEELNEQENNEEETSASNNPPNGFKQKTKKKAKETGRNIITVFKDGIKNIWKKRSIKIKIIIAIVVIIVLIVLLLLSVILEFLTDSSLEAINTYMSSDTVKETDAGKLYEETGSLLLMTDKQVDDLTNQYLQSISQKTPNYYNLLLTIPDPVEGNSGVPVTGNAITLGETAILYKHILNSERYNFNRIVWKEYYRDSNTATNMKLTYDPLTRLQYPKDNEKDLSYFVNLVRPYLQSWVIPMSMLSGVATDAQVGKADSFAHEIINDAYHEIEIEKRNLISYDVLSEYREYDQTTYTVSVTRTCEEVEDPKATYTETYYETEVHPCRTLDIRRGTCPDTPKSGYRYVQVEKTRTVTGKKTVCNDTTQTTSNTEHIVEKEVKTGTKSKITSVYNYKKIKTFDKVIDYTIKVNKYNLNNEPDRIDKKEITYYEAEPAKFPDIPAGAGSGVYTTSYVVKEGVKYEITKNWNDTITTTRTERNYNIDDIKENSSEGLTLNEITYYEKLEKNKELNVIDIMNANKSNYDNYIQNLNYSRNIGYTRDQLQVAYRILKEHISEIFDKDTKGVAYGESLGLEVAYSGALGEFSLEVVQDINTNAEYVAPVQDEALILQDNLISTNVYGYAGHTGIDISYPYAKANSTNCTDYPGQVSRCPYVAGPPVYTVQEGELVAVAYSPYNSYYKTGTRQANTEGNLKGGDSEGSYVKIKHTSPSGKVTYSIYYHLYPDYQQLKELSNKIGETLPAGAYVGHMGNTGYSSGLHLHFEYGTTLFRIGNGGTSLAILRLAGM